MTSIRNALARGKALWSGLDEPLSLGLIGTQAFSSGSVLLKYEPAG